ncbi:hypothetical protein BSKO_07404 [Bryopsis sp. KO-2023]|nr:hypothetical protein BSKO_07404 [Bryopsis sp. KO-2023]
MDMKAVVLLGVCAVLVATASGDSGCGLDLSDEVQRFKADLVEMSGGQQVVCSSYPIKLFPCLFCECQDEWEFVKEDPQPGAEKATENQYQCRWRGDVAENVEEAQKTIQLVREDAAKNTERVRRGVQNVRDNVKRATGNPLGAVTRDPETGKYFFTQDDNAANIALEGGRNLIRFEAGLEVSDELSESTSGARLRGDFEAGINGGAVVSERNGVWRTAVVGTAAADGDIRVRVGPGIDR